jgi:thiamine-phosphate pyrophosphorylase
MTDACRLYLITPERFDLDSFAPALTEALAGGDVACVQLRLKDVPDDAICAAARTLAPIAQDRDVAFIMNDRPDLALETGCDGVHIGQQDARYDVARDILGTDAVIGVTCHDSRHLAMVAAEQGADYVAFGAFFPTATKDAIGHPEVEILNWWSEMMVVPSVAIGGITPENCPGLVRAGADFLAVVSAVWNHADGPGEAVKRFNRIIEETPKPGD